MESIMSQVTGDYLKAREKLVKNGLPKGITAFGSARIPMNDPHVQEVEEIASLCAKRSLKKNKKISFITGGGPSIMDAWLKGAHEAGGIASGIALSLPHEPPEMQLKNCNKDISVTMQTFEARKALLFEFSSALVVFKGGFGTMDELFAVLTLMKTKRIPEIPVFIYPASFYKNTLNFKSFIDMKTINPSEQNILRFMRSKKALLKALYDVIDNA
jgi:uncharacterized protein (TIGR00730 family)